MHFVFININKLQQQINKRKTIMQNRYCTCGCKVKVDYILNGGKFMPIFQARQARQVQVKNNTTCPNCGKLLSIDELG